MFGSDQVEVGFHIVAELILHWSLSVELRVLLRCRLQHIWSKASIVMLRDCSWRCWTVLWRMNKPALKVSYCWDLTVALQHHTLLTTSALSSISTLPFLIKFHLSQSCCCQAPLLFLRPKLPGPTSNNVLRVQCSRINPIPFTFGGVIAERVNTAKLPGKINPIFGRSLASSRIIMIAFTVHYYCYYHCCLCCIIVVITMNNSRSSNNNKNNSN